MLDIQCANHEDCGTSVRAQDKIHGSETLFVNGYNMEAFCRVCKIKLQINVTSEELE